MQTKVCPLHFGTDTYKFTLSLTSIVLKLYLSKLFHWILLEIWVFDKNWKNNNNNKQWQQQQQRQNQIQCLLHTCTEHTFTAITFLQTTVCKENNSRKRKKTEQLCFCRNQVAEHEICFLAKHKQIDLVKKDKFELEEKPQVQHNFS